MEKICVGELEGFLKFLTPVFLTNFGMLWFVIVMRRV